VRSWLGLRLAAALLATTAAVFILYGTDLSLIAGLQLSGQAAAIAIVNGIWCVCSVAGGFAYGAVRTAPSLFVLVTALGVATLPVAIGGPWWMLGLLLVLPGLLCAPALAAGSEAVSSLAPEHARGVITGLQGSAITIGAAIATPLTGQLIDMASPSVALLVVGGFGIAIGIVASLMARRGAPPAMHAVAVVLPVPLAVEVGEPR
jgi:MFS family permease